MNELSQEVKETSFDCPAFKTILKQFDFVHMYFLVYFKIFTV